MGLGASVSHAHWGCEWVECNAKTNVQFLFSTPHKQLTGEPQTGLTHFKL